MKMDYLIRFSQSHETFRLPEIQALALIEGVDMKVISYTIEVSLTSSQIQSRFLKISMA